MLIGTRKWWECRRSARGPPTQEKGTVVTRKLCLPTLQSLINNLKGGPDYLMTLRGATSRTTSNRLFIHASPKKDGVTLLLNNHPYKKPQPSMSQQWKLNHLEQGPVDRVAHNRKSHTVKYGETDATLKWLLAASGLYNPELIVSLSFMYSKSTSILIYIQISPFRWWQSARLVFPFGKST